MIEIDGYEAIDRIGQGGLGDVYRATRRSTGGTVAIKVLRDVSDESVVWHRTRRELTALVALAGHGNVIQLLELLDLPEGPALVMEYAPGGSVAGLQRERDAPLTVAETVLIGRQTAAALVAAHEQGIVHRDIKPQNLLIDAYGQVKLCDFGVAALTRSDDFRTRTNALSMRYASPEDLDDEIDVGPESDIYSLGATLLHLARGAPPTLKERLAPWVPPETDDEELAALDTVVAMCLRPDPRRRPTAAGLLDELERLDWSLRERCRTLPPAAAGVVVASVEAGELERASEPVAVASTVPAGGDDDTVHRGPPRPAPEPEPEPDETSNRRVRVITASLLALVIVGAVVAVVWWRDDDTAASPDDGAAATTVVTTPTTGATTTTSVTTSPDELIVVSRPDALTPIDDPAIVWPFGEPGECLRQEPDADELAAVACDEPHDLQRYAVAELDDDQIGSSYDADAVRAAVDAACRAAFAPFVGIGHDESELDTPFTVPSADTWADGDRRYQCFVGVAGARLVGDATGAER